MARYAAELGNEDAVWPALFSDVEMQLPLRRVLEARASAGAADTFAYLFGWEAPERGAFHAVDIPFTFDTFDVDGWGEFVGYDADADRLGRELRAAWAAFARRRSGVAAVPGDARVRPCVRRRGRAPAVRAPAGLLGGLTGERGGEARGR